MRFEEFEHGVLIPVNNDEIKIYDRIRDSITNAISSEDLAENEVELARRMVVRGILTRRSIDGSTYYQINEDPIWRK